MGDIAIAPVGCLHGIFNHSDNDPLIFISVVSPGDAGYRLVEFGLMATEA